MSRFLPKAVGPVLDGLAAPFTRAWYAWAQGVNMALGGMPWDVGGKLIEDEVLAVGNNDIAHGLGRSPVGWLVVEQNAAGGVYRGVAAAPTVDIRLVSDAIMTVDLWVW